MWCKQINYVVYTQVRSLVVGQFNYLQVYEKKEREKNELSSIIQLQHENAINFLQFISLKTSSSVDDGNNKNNNSSEENSKEKNFCTSHSINNFHFIDFCNLIIIVIASQPSIDLGHELWHAI